MSSEGLTMREILTGHIHERERGKGLTPLPEYPHIYVKDIEHYNSVKALAEKIGGEALASFTRNFEARERSSVNSETVVEVFPDSDPHSFYFRHYDKDGKLYMDGGIILHGMGATHSAELIPREGVYWSTHT